MSLLPDQEVKASEEIKFLSTMKSISAYCKENELIIRRKRMRPARYRVAFTCDGKRREYQIMSEYMLDIKEKNYLHLMYVEMVEIATNSGSEHFVRRNFISKILKMVMFGGCTDIERQVESEDWDTEDTKALVQKYDDLNELVRGGDEESPNMWYRIKCLFGWDQVPEDW